MAKKGGIVASALHLVGLNAFKRDRCSKQHWKHEQEEHGLCDDGVMGTRKRAETV